MSARASAIGRGVTPMPNTTPCETRTYEDYKPGSTRESAVPLAVKEAVRQKSTRQRDPHGLQPAQAAIHGASRQAGDGAEKGAMTKFPKVQDNDRDEILAVFDGIFIRGWSYSNEAERRVKMLCAREFCEGWFQAIKHLATAKEAG